LPGFKILGVWLFVTNTMLTISSVWYNWVVQLYYYGFFEMGSNNYYVRAELPGMKSDELDIQVTGNGISISGERKIPMEGNNVKYHRREREAGTFSRSINLPGEIDVNKVEASMENGVLKINIPKSEAAKPRQITVK
jgi:HSP20 family protein